MLLTAGFLCFFIISVLQECVEHYVIPGSEKVELWPCFDGHSYYARCRDKGKGEEPNKETTDCKFCNALTPEQRTQLVTPQMISCPGLDIPVQGSSLWSVENYFLIQTEKGETGSKTGRQ